MIKNKTLVPIPFRLVSPVGGGAREKHEEPMESRSAGQYELFSWGARGYGPLFQ